MSLTVLLADGLRPDTLRRALDDGRMPSLARLREAGGMFEVTSAFPTVTGPAYTPFLLGRFPGSVGLPGLRWYDRARTVVGFPHARSYVGHQLFAADRDLDPTAPTIFELVPRSAAAMTMITRGLPRERRLTALTIRSAIRGLRTHFAGDIEDWLDFDRDTARQVLACARDPETPYLFAAFMGVDKVSHDRGHDDPGVAGALRIVDDTVGELLDVRTRRDPMRVWVASDHGHSAVAAHDDLHAAIRARGYRAIAHPWPYWPRADIAVMVSGNAMAHLYLELGRRSRAHWAALANRWEDLARWLVGRESVDLALLPLDDARCLVRSRRGTATVAWHGALVSYRRDAGDPLAIGADLDDVTVNAAHDATAATAYPDSVVQVARLAACSRSGDIILSATPGWDFRERYEPIPHVSTHGGLHRDHMMVPLLLDAPPARLPRRTADVMPSSLAALGIPAPAGLDGTSFV